MGFVSYIRNHHILGSIAFILAIASKMLALFMAIATEQLIVTIAKSQNIRIKNEY